MSTVPYTYLLEWSSTGMKYYGVRYAKNCGPADLWNPYQTSSKYVKEHVATYGDPDVIRVRKTFFGENAIARAQAWETRVLKTIDAVKREDYLNRTDNRSIHPGDCAKSAKLAAPKRRGRTKFTHSGVASAALKRAGRTKETHYYIAAQAQKLTGRTKETHQYVHDRAQKLTGRTKETHKYLADISAKMTGRTKETHPYIAKRAEAVAGWASKRWEITYPDGKKIITFNISSWCRDNDFPRGSITTKRVKNGYSFAVVSPGEIS